MALLFIPYIVTLLQSPASERSIERLVILCL